MKRTSAGSELAKKEQELKQLTKAHDQMVKEFNELIIPAFNAKVAVNRAKYYELTGAIGALRGLAPGS